MRSDTISAAPKPPSASTTRSPCVSYVSLTDARSIPRQNYENLHASLRPSPPIPVESVQMPVFPPPLSCSRVTLPPRQPRHATPRLAAPRHTTPDPGTGSSTLVTPPIPRDSATEKTLCPSCDQSSQCRADVTSSPSRPVTRRVTTDSSQHISCGQPAPRSAAADSVPEHADTRRVTTDVSQRDLRHQHVPRDVTLDSSPTRHTPTSSALLSFDSPDLAVPARARPKFSKATKAHHAAPEPLDSTHLPGHLPPSSVVPISAHKVSVPPPPPPPSAPSLSCPSPNECSTLSEANQIVPSSTENLNNRTNSNRAVLLTIDGLHDLSKCNFANPDYSSTSQTNDHILEQNQLRFNCKHKNDNAPKNKSIFNNAVVCGVASTDSITNDYEYGVSQYLDTYIRFVNFSKNLSKMQTSLHNYESPFTSGNKNIPRIDPPKPLPAELFDPPWHFNSAVSGIPRKDPVMPLPDELMDLASRSIHLVTSSA